MKPTTEVRIITNKKRKPCHIIKSMTRTESFTLVGILMWANLRQIAQNEAYARTSVNNGDYTSVEGMDNHMRDNHIYVKMLSVIT